MIRARTATELIIRVALIGTLGLTLRRLEKSNTSNEYWREVCGEKEEMLGNQRGAIARLEENSESLPWVGIVPLDPEICYKLEMLKACDSFITNHPAQAYDLAVGFLKDLNCQSLGLRRVGKGLFLEVGTIKQRVSSFRELQACELYRSGVRITQEDLSPKEASRLNYARNNLKQVVEVITRRYLLGEEMPTRVRKDQI